MRDFEFVLKTLRSALETRYGSVDEFLLFLQKKEIDLQNLSLVQIEAHIEEFCELGRQTSEFRGVEGVEDEYRYQLGNEKPVALTDFFLEDVEVKVVEESFRKKFLLFSESEYVIETIPLGWKVGRTAAHLAELESLLREALPFTFVPPFGPAEFGKLAKQAQSGDARKQHIQLFLNALVENPYTKNSGLLRLFLSSDLFDEDLARLRQQKTLKGEFARLFGGKQAREAQAAEGFLKSLPAFRPNAVMVTDHCTIQLSHSLQPFLQKLAEMDAAVLRLSKEIKAKAQGLGKSLSGLAQLLASRAALKEGLARDFDLDYGPHISLADAHAARWVESLRAGLKRTQDYFSAASISALSYERLRDESFGRYQREVVEMRALARARRAGKEGPEGGGEAVETLKAYLTSMLNFSFKHMMVFRNRRECEALDQKLTEARAAADCTRQELSKLQAELREKTRIFPSNKAFIANFVAMAEEN